MARTKIAFLYSEIAGYFLACANSLAQQADVLIIRWPTNVEAPFEFQSNSQLKIMVKSDHSQAELKQTLDQFNPDTVVCSGWMDKDYLKLMKGLDKRVNRVLSLDNHWRGDLKQRIASVVSPLHLKRYFSHAWVPGEPQAVFAKKLGFGSKTLTGFYCADTTFFESKFKATFADKQKAFPKRFLYVARYVEHKGIFEMWEAFRQLQDENPNDWELWCLGTGDQWDNRVVHDKIKHFGFVQPEDMDDYLAKTGVYILPSKFEPWGVSVQEMAIAGFPLILSTAIGSAEQFLNKNGFQFESGNTMELKNSMKKIMELSETELYEMGKLSHALGMQYTTDDWAERIQRLSKN